MNVVITEKNKKYEFKLKKISQFCGYNIKRKTYILDSLSKRFSAYRYQEWEQKYKENVVIDGRIPGREYFDVIRIRDIKDVQTAVGLSKNSLMMGLIKEKLQQFEVQDKLVRIDEMLSEIFAVLNANLTGALGSLELDYDMASLFEIIQKSEIRQNNGCGIEDMDAFEAINALVDLINERQQRCNKKILVIFENVDHLLNADECKKLIKKCDAVSRGFDVYFLFTMSIDGYVHIDRESIEGISVFNDEEVFVLSEFEKLQQYILYRYPYERKWDYEDMVLKIGMIVNRIGESRLIGVDCLVLQKILNSSEQIKTSVMSKPNVAEIACLCSEHML